jgi:hypothetical protein
MKTSALIILGAVLALSMAVELKYEQDVLVLDDSNFDEAIK